MSESVYQKPAICRCEGIGKRVDILHAGHALYGKFFFAATAAVILIGSMISSPAPRNHVGVSIAHRWQIRYDERHDGEVTDEWKRLSRCLVLPGILWCLPCIQLFALGSYLYPMKRSTYAIHCTIRRYLLVTPRIITREFTRVKGHPLDAHDDYLP